MLIVVHQVVLQVVFVCDGVTVTISLAVQDTQFSGKHDSHGYNV